MSQEVYQPRARILQTDDDALTICLMLLNELCEGAETIMVKVESVSGKHITMRIGYA